MIGMNYQQCDVVLVPFLHSDLREEKTRPVLILSNQRHHVDSNDFIGCMITKNLRNDLGKTITLQSKHFEQGNLEFESILKPCHLLTIKQNVIKRRIARLSKDIVQMAVQEIKNSIELKNDSMNKNQ